MVDCACISPVKSVVTATPQNDSAQTLPAQEQAWVTQALGGDLLAFNAIVERYQQLAYNLSLRMLRDASLAEDVTQEAFFSAYRNLPQFRNGSLKSWLLTIAANRSRDILRSPARKRTLSLEAYVEGGDSSGPWVDPDDLPEQQTERADESRLVREAIDQLPGDQRLVVILIDLQQMNYEEASGITGASLGTVKSRLYRGRQQLKNLLRPVWELSTDAGRPNL